MSCERSGRSVLISRCSCRDRSCDSCTVFWQSLLQLTPLATKMLLSALVLTLSTWSRCRSCQTLRAGHTTITLRPASASGTSPLRWAEPSSTRCSCGAQQSDTGAWRHSGTALWALWCEHAAWLLLVLLPAWGETCCCCCGRCVCNCACSPDDPPSDAAAGPQVCQRQICATMLNCWGQEYETLNDMDTRWW